MKIKEEDLKKILKKLDNFEYSKQFNDKIKDKITTRLLEVREMMNNIDVNNIIFYSMTQFNKQLHKPVDYNEISNHTNLLCIGLAMNEVFQESIVELLEKESQNARGK